MRWDFREALAIRKLSEECVVHVVTNKLRCSNTYVLLRMSEKSMRMHAQQWMRVMEGGEETKQKGL